MVPSYLLLLLFLFAPFVVKAQEAVNAENVLCIQKCQNDGQSKIEAATQMVNDSLSTILKGQEAMCKAIKGIKSCLLQCQNGEVAWEIYKKSGGKDGPNFSQILQLCDSDQKGNLTDPKLCAHQCQLVSAEDLQKIFGDGIFGDGPLLTTDETPMGQLDQAKQGCELYRQLNQCFLGCPDGNNSWKDFVATMSNGNDSSSGPSLIKICGLDGAPGSSTKGFCSLECQTKSMQEIQSLQITDSKEFTPSEGIETTKKTCDAYRKLKKCIYACPNGQSSWTEFIKETSGDPAKGSSGIVAICGLDRDVGETGTPLLCKQKCYIKSMKDFEPFAGNNTELSPADRIKGVGQACKGYNNIRSCLLACPDGEALYKEFADDITANVSSADGPSVLELCGIGDGTASPGASALCAQACQTKAAQEVQNLQVADGQDITKKTCNVYGELKACLLACPNGRDAWNEITMNNAKSYNTAYYEIQSLLKQCGLDGSDSRGGSGVGLLCAQECQLKVSAKFKIGETVTTTAEPSLAALFAKKENMCESLREMHNCITSCPNGNNIWDDLPKDDIEEILVACGITTTKATGMVTRIPYQCYKGSCAKCSDLPNGVCSPKFITYDSEDDCSQIAGCFKYDESIRSDPCMQGAPDTGLPAIESRVLCSGGTGGACDSGLACNPVYQHGESYCCPDTTAQEQKTCVSKCSTVNRYSFYKLSVGGKQGFKENVQDMCKQYDVFKECVQACPNGKEALDKERQKMKANSDPVSGNLLSVCENRNMTSADTPTGLSTCPEQDKYTEYCKVALQQEGKEMCFLEGFKGNCGKTCCNV